MFDQYWTFTAKERAETLRNEIDCGALSDVDFYLSELLRERDPLVRWFLLKGIGVHRANSAIEPLLATFRAPDVNLGSASLHLIAAWSLGQIGPAAIPQIISALETSTNETEIASLADSLGEIADPSCVGRLKELLEHGTSRIQLWAALSLAKIGKPALPTLSELLATRESTPSAALIADAIGKINRDYFTDRAPSTV